MRTEVNVAISSSTPRVGRVSGPRVGAIAASEKARPDRHDTRLVAGNASVKSAISEPRSLVRRDRFEGSDEQRRQHAIAALTGDPTLRRDFPLWPTLDLAQKLDVAKRLRTLGSWQVDTGATLAIVGKTLNHKSQQTTTVYARLSMDPVRAAMTKATEAMVAAARGKKEAEPKDVANEGRRFRISGGMIVRPVRTLRKEAR